MGHSCSKTTGTLDDYDQQQHGFVLESDPRNRRRRSQKQKKGISLSSSAPCHQGKGGGIYRWDPPLFALQQQSICLQQENPPSGQYHLLYKHQQKLPRSLTPSTTSSPPSTRRRRSPPAPLDTSEDGQIENFRPITTDDDQESLSLRLVVRRHQVRASDEGMTGTHIYAVRWPRHSPLQLSGVARPEQYPQNMRVDVEEINNKAKPTRTTDTATTMNTKASPASPASPPFLMCNSSSNNSSVDYLFHPSTLAAPPKKQGTCVLREK
jgi:hypothetical protein